MIAGRRWTVGRKLEGILDKAFSGTRVLHVPHMQLTLYHTKCRQALDRWEERLEGIFDGRPYDILDAALTDTVSQYPVHIQPFRDMIDGMRMDLVKSR